MTSSVQRTPVTPSPEGLGVAARILAGWHADPAPPDPERSILNLAESPRADDWSLRAALVRLAQPEPVRAGAVLEVVRRCLGALQPLGRSLERHTVWTRPALGPASLRSTDAPPATNGPWELTDEGPRRADIRLADLARLAGGDALALDTLAAAYADEAAGTAPLEAEETAALGLVSVATELDQLADELARWAVTAAGPPPVAMVDAVCLKLAPELDRLGVPREVRPEDVPPGARRGGGERGPGRRRP